MIIESNILITNTTFSTNTANFREGEHCHRTEGGALLISHSRVSLHGCNFEHNRANVGGAIFSKSLSDVIINNSTFTSNKATDCTHGQSCLGGALYAGERCNVTILNSTFQNNTSDGDGGVAVVVRAIFLMAYSYAFSNTAGSISTGAASHHSLLDFESGIFPHSRTRWNGGAIHFYQSNATIKKCNFSGNVAENGGVLSVERECNVSVEMCFFSDNIASIDGGALVAKSLCKKLPYPVAFFSRIKQVGTKQQTMMASCAYLTDPSLKLMRVSLTVILPVTMGGPSLYTITPRPS